MPTQNLLEAIGRTPVVPLRHVARGLAVPVLVKCEHMNPGGSVKDRIALAIVDDAERRGVLRPGETLIEAMAGNTAFVAAFGKSNSVRPLFLCFLSFRQRF